jgi:hypothetical protein
MVSDYEPQVAMGAMAFDPIIDVLSSGFVFDVRPHFLHGQEQIAVDLRAQLVGGVEVREVDAGTPHAAPLQAAKGDHARWEADVLCAKGRWTLVGLQSRGKGEDAEEVALFLRARHNVLK